MGKKNLPPDSREGEAKKRKVGKTSPLENQLKRKASSVGPLRGGGLGETNLEPNFKPQIHEKLQAP